MDLDTTDRDLLAALLEDARISQRGLAKRVGVAQGTITNRLRRLEEMGVIKGYTVLLDAESIGWTMTLLMDWDRTGGKLQSNLRRRLESFDVMIDENLRKNLMKTLKPETRVVESLGGLAGALIPYMDLEATIRTEQE